MSKSACTYFCPWSNPYCDVVWLARICITRNISDSLDLTAGKSRPGKCPSPATAARMMPPPSTGRWLGPPAHGPTSHATACPTSTPRPHQRKKRRRAAHGHILMTQESPDSDSDPAQGMQYMRVHILDAGGDSFCYQQTCCHVNVTTMAIDTHYSSWPWFGMGHHPACMHC